MKIILPAHNKKADKVFSWAEISKEANEMRELMKQPFKGNWNRAHSLAQPQVSENPKTYFVLNEMWIPTFKSWIVVNPKIISKLNLNWEHIEACMSFPFRKPKYTKRDRTIWLFYWIPFWGFLIPQIRRFKEMAAFIVQHEMEHFNSKNIYGL